MKWDVFAVDNMEPFSVISSNGKLQISIDREKFVNSDLYLDVNSDGFSKNTNGISVDMLSNSSPVYTSPTGVLLTLTDGKSKMDYRCYTILAVARLFCELEDAVSGYQMDAMDALSILPNQSNQLQIEWIPETGLLLTFLNQQLIYSQQLDIESPIWMESAKIFVRKVNSYAEDEIFYDNFRIGTYQETEINLPDDLYPPIEQPVLYSQNGIEYYLYDSFEEPYYENKYDLRRWDVLFGLGDTNLLRTESFMGQKNGTLYFEGNTIVDMVPIMSNDELRAIQFDILPTTNDRSSGGMEIQLNVKNSEVIHGNENFLLSYFCSPIYVDGPNDKLWCAYIGTDNQFIISSFEMPFSDRESHQVRLQYDDKSGVFQTYMNDKMVDEVIVLDEHRQKIVEFGLKSAVLIDTGTDENIAIDNFIIGRKSDVVKSTGVVGLPTPVDMLPHSDLYLHDDFEDENFDFSWNSHLWSGILSEDNSGIYQNDGALVVGDKPESGFSSWVLYNQGFNSIGMQNANAVKIEFQADENDFPHDRAILFNAFLMDDEADIGENVHGVKLVGGVLNCRVLFENENVFVECSSCFEFEGCTDYEMVSLTGYVGNSAKLHNIALEHDEESNKYYIYFDDTLLGTYDTPENYDPLHTFPIQVLSGDNPDGTIRIENVFIGYSASHPELMSNYIIQSPEENIKSENDDQAPEISKVDVVELEKFKHENGLQLSIDGGYVEDEDIIVLPKGTQNHRGIYSYLPDEFAIHEINKASIKFSPIEIPPNGWDVYFGFSDTDGSYQFQCIIRYDFEFSNIQCHESVNSIQDDLFQSDEITFNPTLPHDIAIEVDPDTYLLHILLDGEAIIDVDTRQPASFFREGRFQYGLMVVNINSSAPEFKLRFEDIEVELLE
ncbi:MAG: hypothetical protein JEZ00_06410 [Anaerolineaceae bacterium]|nr:hypothetical protein [Anaerolineaceae bacterium]